MDTSTMNCRQAVQTVNPLEHPACTRDSNMLARQDERAQHHRQQLRLSLFGGLALHIEDRRIELASRKAKALIAYLALTPGMRASREHLVGLFWSETENCKARASLRQLLHVLRDFFESESIAGFSSGRFEVSLDAQAVATDVGDAVESIARGYPVESLMNEAFITDTILAGYDDLDPSFRGWLQAQRESIRQRLIRNLEAQLSRTPCVTDCTRRLAHALFQVDPTHEMACRKLMCAYVEAGDVAGALAIYKKLWDHLDNDYDMEPSTATQELVAEIKSGTYQALTHAPTREIFHPDRPVTAAQEHLPWPFTEQRYSQYVRGPSVIYLPIPYDLRRQFA